MPTAPHASSTASRTAPAKRPRATAHRAPDAIRLLKDDHKAVKALFKAYETLVKKDGSDAAKMKIAQQICTALTVHATVEEELLYPAAREALPAADEDLVDEATVEHAGAKELIAQIEASSPKEALFDARVKVLGEYIAHHVKEEETEMFPLLRKQDLDLKALGVQIAQRKKDL